MKPSYSWLLKWILAAILIAVGLVFFFEKKLVFLISGMVIIIFSIFRVRPLLKSLNKEVLRTLNLIEIVLGTLVGALLIVVGVKALNNELDLSGGWGLVYRYSLVFIFAARALVYFYSVTFLEEKTEQVKFWAHAALLPLATVIATSKNFDAEWVGWLLLIISLFGGVYLVYDGYKGYGKYRKYQLSIQDAKEVKDKKKKEKEKPKDSLIIEEDKDRPYVN